MTDVFISYSRRNTKFARELLDRIILIGKDAWVDWEGIPLTSPNWWSEIQAGIESADSFVFIMSPDSMASVVCNMELDYAIELGKRILPVVHLEVDSKDAFASIADFEPDTAMKERLKGKDPLMIARENWQQLSHINWVFFRETDDFDAAFKALINAIETDLTYVKAHTRYFTRAAEWQREQKPDDLLLFGDEIERGEEWLSKADRYATQQQSGQKQAVVNPLAQPIQREYITTSRQADQRRKRLVRSAQLAIGVLVVAIIAGIGIAAGIINQTQQEVDNVQATSDRNVADANTLVAGANEELTSIPPTLTEIGVQVVDAQDQAAAANTLAADANNALTAVPPTLTEVGVQVITAQDQAAAAQTEVGIANNALTAIPPTLTEVGVQVVTAQDQAAAAQTEVGIANATLIPIPATLTEAAVLRDDAERLSAFSTDFSLLLLDSSLNQAQIIERLDSLVDTYSEFPIAYRQRATILIEFGEIEAAIEDYERALELSDDPQFQAFVNNDIAISYTDLGQFETALTYYDAAIALSPDDGGLYSNRASIFLLLGDPNRAIEDLDRAITIDAPTAFAYTDRAAAHIQLGDLEAALADANRAIDTDPNAAFPYFQRGEIYFQLSSTDNRELIIADWQQAQDLEFELPDYALEFIESSDEIVAAPPDNQDQGSVDGRIALGETSGNLEIGTQDVWIYSGRQGERLTISVDAEWDVIVDVFIRDEEIGFANAFGAEGTEVIDGIYLETNDDYLIRVSGAEDNQGGPYTVTVSSTDGPGIDTQPLVIGDNAGEVDFDERIYYVYEGAAGEVLSFTLIAEFDTTLTVIDANGDLVDFNDESDLPNGNSQLQRVEFENAGAFIIVVAGYDGTQVGSYTLTVEPVD